MERRSDLLMEELRDLLGTDEVYFQPAPDFSDNSQQVVLTGIEYPCFIIRRTTAYQPRADDRTYLFRPGYEVIFINRDEPDHEMIKTMINHFQRCRYERHYVSDNLHHDVFMIYY